MACITRALSDEITCLSRLKGALYSSLLHFLSFDENEFFFFFSVELVQQFHRENFHCFSCLSNRVKKINENTRAGIKRADSVQNLLYK